MKVKKLIAAAVSVTLLIS
ncbi:Protein of unknown function [Bacillus cereus]|nr:Protein of unknown function [Bacillus cereus]